MLTTLLAALAVAAPPGDAIPIRWEFRDAATFNGRPLLTYCPVELADRSPRPLHADDDPGPGSRFGFLPVGNHLDGHRLLIWRPDGAAGPDVWIDGNGDGRFGPGERHRIDAQPAEIPITMSVKTGSFARFVARTVLLRAAADGGVRYAVRGYAAGPLLFGGRSYGALVTDGNGDGCFDSPSGDRVWIDFDGDGRFDARGEQFTLGSPLTFNRRPYLVRPAADGSSVIVRERPTDHGAVQLIVTGHTGERPTGFAAQVVSDGGEALTLSATGRARLPVGRYAIETLAFRMQDGDGKTWDYRFAGERRFDIVVQRDREVTVRPLENIAFHATTKLPQSTIGPGQELPVTPSLRTPAGLELVGCQLVGREQPRDGEGDAEIRLEAPDGSAAERARSGFVCGRLAGHTVHIPADASGLYRLVVSFASGPLAGEVANVRDVRVLKPLPIGR
jgi:hypothetical protein